MQCSALFRMQSTNSGSHVTCFAEKNTLRGQTRITLRAALCLLVILHGISLAALSRRHKKGMLCVQLHNIRPVIPGVTSHPKESDELVLFVNGRKITFSTLLFLDFFRRRFMFWTCDTKTSTRRTHSLLPLHKPLIPSPPVFPLPCSTQLAKQFPTTHESEQSALPAKWVLRCTTKLCPHHVWCGL